jgi:hypothetical protein
MIDSWLKDVESGKYIFTAFLDLQKAFDLVDHEIFLYRLKLNYFYVTPFKLFHLYLSNGMQIIQIGDWKSDVQNVTSGISQGSILGPLLFLLYINDLSNMCKDFS